MTFEKVWNENENLPLIRLEDLFDKYKGGKEDEKYVCKRCKDTFECRDMEHFTYCEECEKDLEGEKIKIGAKNGTSEAFAIMECYHNCIIKESEANALRR